MQDSSVLHATETIIRRCGIRNPAFCIDKKYQNFCLKFVCFTALKNILYCDFYTNYGGRH